MINYENHTVLLENGTIGTISRYSIGYQDVHLWLCETVTVVIHDENGCFQRVEGKMVEVLEVAHLDSIK